MTGSFKYRFWLFVILLGCAGYLTLGCGSNSGESANGVDPIEVEVGASLDAFFASVAARNLEAAMTQVDSNLQYYRAGSSAPLGYVDFTVQLSGFISKAASITLLINDRGIVADGENTARVRGILVCQYYTGGSLQTLQETCEILYERVSRWGIRSLSRYNQEGMSFPP